MMDSLAAALEQLAAGRVVAAATESFFGLLADIGNPLAVEALFALKPRGADKGVPIILPERGAWQALVAGAVPCLAQAFASAFWPGGLSISLPAAEGVAARVAQGGSLAVRVPGISPAAELARRYRRPLSATSANLPRRPPRCIPIRSPRLSPTLSHRVRCSWCPARVPAARRPPWLPSAKGSTRWLALVAFRLRIWTQSQNTPATLDATQHWR